MKKETYLNAVTQIEKRLKRYAKGLTESEEKGEDLYQRTIAAVLKQLLEIPDEAVMGWTYKTMHDLFVTDYKEEIRTRIEASDSKEREKLAKEEEIRLCLKLWVKHPTA